MADPWAAFNPQGTATAPSAPVPQAADPWAAYSPQAPSVASVDNPQISPEDHPLTINGRGRSAGSGSAAVAPGDATAAVGHNLITGVPIVGPIVGKALDYTAAGLRSATMGGSFDDALQHVQDFNQATDDAHPVASTVGGIAGAALATAPLIAAAPAVFGAGAGPLTAGKVLAGLGSGAAIGGTDAAIRSGGDPGAVGLGVVAGGLGGAAGPAVAAGASRVGTALADTAAQALALRNIGVTRPVADILTRAAEADGALNGVGAANIAAAGPDGMLADAGPGMANVLDTALQRGGPGAVAARQAVEQRASQADAGLTQAMDSAFGPPQGIQTATNDIRTSTAQARQQAYDAAYASPIDYSSEDGRALEQMVRDRVPGGIIARANAQMRIDGDTSRQIMARIADDGTVSYERLPDVRQLDYITRSLRDVAQRGDGQGALGGNTSEGRSYGNLARDLRDTLRQAVPAYGTALDTAAQPIQARNALDFGATMLRPNVPRDVVADTIQGMTQPEMRQARQGLRSAMAEVLANVKRTITDPNVDARQAMDVVKQLSSDAAQEKVGLLVSRQEREALNQALLRATRALELRAAVSANSRTAARLITNQGVKDATAPGVIGTLAEAKPYHAAQKAVQLVTGRRPVDLQRREDEVYGDLARALTGPRGAQATGFLDRLQRAHATRAAATSVARNLPYGTAAQTGVLSLLPALNKSR